jgi:adenosylcobyric acid synthase
VRDSGHIESDEGSVRGLGLLPVVTDFEPVKATHQVETTVTAGRGLFEGCTGLPARGYEIHMGRTAGATEPLLSLSRRSGAACQGEDGALDGGGWVAGTYLHGLFDNDALRGAVLANVGRRAGLSFCPGLPLDRAAEYDRLADCLRAEFDLAWLRRLIGLEAPVWAT